MRFYLNLPLFVGYVLMATTSCLGMLQWAAARGGYAGLALFSEDRRWGARLGAGLTLGALLAYVVFAPEILTPGPAGTEVAEMFTGCALLALGVTLAGADLRLQRVRAWEPGNGERVPVGDISGTLLGPLTTPQGSAPAVVLMPDPTGFVAAPAGLVERLQQAGMAVLVLDAQGVSETADPYTRRALLGHLSTALVKLTEQPDIDPKRVGLLGLGLGGDAILRAVAFDHNTAAVMAVSPMESVRAPADTAPIPSPTTRGQTAVDQGLHWLHELSYLQAWRWRRRRPIFERAVVNLGRFRPDKEALMAPAAILLSNGEESVAHAWPGVEVLNVPSPRHFTLLKDETATQLVVDWLHEKLKF